MAEIKLPSRADIIAHCGRCTMAAQGHAFSDDIWIKYGTTVTPAEASTQDYVQQHADPRLVRIPPCLRHLYRAPA